MAMGLGFPMGLSAPVAFQYPDPAARFGLDPLGYFLSLGEKKYHSFSPYSAIPVHRHRPIENQRSIFDRENSQFGCLLGNSHGLYL